MRDVSKECVDLFDIYTDDWIFGFIITICAYLVVL